MKKLLALITLIVLLPLTAQAQVPAGWWRITTFTSEVDALPKEKEDHVKIPILIGIAPGSFKKNYGVTYSNGSVHQGQDIFAPRGAYVVSPTKAVVTRVDTAGAGGIAVYTANPGSETFYYAHLTAVGPLIKPGAVLNPGDLIGYVGNTGDAEGSSTHLHFQIFSLDGVIDPNPRLTDAFSDDERMQALTNIINHSDDKERAAAAIVSLYKNYLSSIDHAKLPIEIDAALSAKAMEQMTAQTQSASASAAPATAAVSASSSQKISQNLRAGIRSDEVKLLQHYLIDHKTGTYAKTLATYGATGYYGALTRAAVAELQKSAGIAPAVGYCGPATRAYINAHA